MEEVEKSAKENSQIAFKRITDAANKGTRFLARYSELTNGRIVYMIMSVDIAESPELAFSNCLEELAEPSGEIDNKDWN
jgi:hypothetical protein